MLKRLASERRLKIQNMFPTLTQTALGEKTCTEFVENINDLSDSSKNSIRNKSVRLTNSEIDLTLNRISIANDILEEINKSDDPDFTSMFEDLLINNFDDSLKDQNQRIYLNVIKELNSKDAMLFTQLVVKSLYFMNKYKKLHYYPKPFYYKDGGYIHLYQPITGGREEERIKVEDESILDNLKRLNLIELKGVYPNKDELFELRWLGSDLPKIISHNKPSDNKFEVSITSLGMSFSKAIKLIE